MLKRLAASMRQHPTGFWFIFWGEAAERSAYYGMRTILALFLTDSLHLSQGKSSLIAHTFSAACYFFCLFGGLIADRWLGKFWTIIVFALPYLLGYPILGAFQNEPGLYVALVLLAFGSGVIKPNLSPLMGSMYDRQGKPEELRSQAFTWFYAAINLGAAVTSIALPFVRSHYGYTTAFMVPVVLMTAALTVFYLGKKHYPEEETTRPSTRSRSVRTLKERQADRRVLVRLAGVFTIIIFFWSVYDQTMSAWVFFAKDHMNLYGFEPDAIQGLNPVLIVAFSPLFNLMWSRLGVKAATTKMMVGYVITAVCMGIMAVAGFSSESAKVSLGWMVAAYVVITFAELCISVVGLEFAYAEAPKHMKSQVTAVFLFTVFLGDLLAGVLTSFYPKMGPGHYFGMLTIMMGAVVVAFWFVARRFRSSAPAEPIKAAA